MFVSAIDHDNHICEVWRAHGAAWFAEPLSNACTLAPLFGRGDEVYAAVGSTVTRFTGGSWHGLNWQGEEVPEITGAPEPDGDIFVTTQSAEIARYHDGKWTTEKLPKPNLVLHAMTYGLDLLSRSHRSVGRAVAPPTEPERRRWVTARPGSAAAHSLYLARPNGEVHAAGAPSAFALHAAARRRAMGEKHEVPFRPVVLWQQRPVRDLRRR